MKELTDEEFEKLKRFKKEFADLIESLEVVISTVHFNTPQLYDFDVDGVTVGKRLQKAKQIISEAHTLLTTLERPLCPDCKVRGVPDVASVAERFDPAMAIDYPEAAIPIFWGGYYCPKCRKRL